MFYFNHGKSDVLTACYFLIEIASLEILIVEEKIEQFIFEMVEKMVLDLTNNNTQHDFNFEKAEEIAILSRSRKNWTTELNLVSYNGNQPVIDLRQWSPEGRMGKGLTLTEQTARNLLLALEAYFGNASNQEGEAEEEGND